MSYESSLQNKTVVVLGAAGDIGRSCANRFREAGAKVISVDITESTEQNSVQIDISDETEVQKLVRYAVANFGSVDVLVNSAAVLTPAAPVHETTLEQFERLLAVNVRGTFLVSKHFYPLLRASGGCMVHISSMSGITGESNHAVYAATKGAINALVQSMAVDYGREGIRVNAVCPGAVETAGARAAIEASTDGERLFQIRNSIHALGRTARPDEVAEVVLFLASPAASFITGALIPVSGGSECGYGIKF